MSYDNTIFNFPQDVPAAAVGLVFLVVFLWMCAMLVGVGVLLTREMLAAVF